MSIQISVIIWTVICFLLLMVILHNWLFKPVLEVMEKRKARIQAAQEKKREAERMMAEHNELLLKQKADLEREQKLKVDAQIEKINTDSKKAVEAARVSRLDTYEVYRKSCYDEYGSIMSKSETSTKQIAETFADRLINQPRNSGIN
ncbi:MAG: ATP synthase F0 subunit B [Clostridia bacterium]|nr:ATP synthase F0 subunit B [Clostridia bacterium]